MDRRNEQQFIDRMHSLVTGLSRSCTGCLRRGTIACRTCWSNEARVMLEEMNTTQAALLPFEKQDRADETVYVLELVNAHLGITVKMVASSMQGTKEQTLQHIFRKLLKDKKVVVSDGCPRVYFPASTPPDAIEAISKTFKKVRKEKHGKS